MILWVMQSNENVTFLDCLTLSEKFHKPLDLQNSSNNDTVTFQITQSSLYSWSVSHFDALFIFSLFSHYTSTDFEIASCPSSGGKDVYMWQLVKYCMS
jgi:hypothetical protein